MKSVVLDGFGVNPGDLSWDFLDKYGEKEIYDVTPQELVAERLKGAEIVLTNRMRIGEKELDACGSIKFVTALGTGYDMIDVDACRKRGVVVCNVPAYSTPSVAQHAFSLLLSLASDVPAWRQAVRNGSWTGRPGFEYQNIRFTELSGKTAGIYGCGTIGRAMGKICASFGMRVLGFRRSKPESPDGDIEYVDSETLLRESDFISFHCPLNDETRGLVNRDLISRTKYGVCFINTSRGAVINEDDLAEALACGRVAGAGLDVLAEEPPRPDNPLLRLDNCIVTPHCAWTSLEARKRLIGIIDRNIDSFVRTGRGITEVGI